MEKIRKEKELKKLSAITQKDNDQNLLKPKPPKVDATTNTEGSLESSPEKEVNHSPSNMVSTTSCSDTTVTMDIPLSRPNLSMSPTASPTPLHTIHKTPSNTCPHSPQCTLRDPNPRPPFAPITFEQFYHPEKPPRQISLLPSRKLSFSEFCELDFKGDHQCEECEPGMLFDNYTERVEYTNPSPSGGTMAQYLRACPNSPRASIYVTAIEIETKLKKFKTQSFQCEICDKVFEN